MNKKKTKADLEKELKAALKKIEGLEARPLAVGFDSAEPESPLCVRCISEKCLTETPARLTHRGETLCLDCLKEVSLMETKMTGLKLWDFSVCNYIADLVRAGKVQS